MASDMLLGRKGDSIKGTVLTPSFRISCALGTIDAKTATIRRVLYADGQSVPNDQLWLVNHDVLTGQILTPSVQFKSEAGVSLDVPKDRILAVLVGWLMAGFAGPGLAD